MPSAEPKPLNILIVGAGIAGFAAAIACRRAGHNVSIYEKSSLNNELGAAIHVCPNASRGLLAWGLDPVKGRFVLCKHSFRAYGSSMVRFHEADDSYITEKYGSPWYLAHRVDLHEELKRLATQEEGGGKPAFVHLNSEAMKYASLEIFYTEAGTIQLADGKIATGDLIITADGVHSGGVEAVLGAPNPAVPTTHYNFCYRFLIPSAELIADSETAHFTENDDGRMKFIVADGRRLVWYPCRNNEVHNFVAIFHNDEMVDHEDWHTPVDVSVMLERYSDFHPSVLAVLRKAKDIKQWPLLFRAPIPTWHKNKLVLIGDAAHPMLPHQGQGGAQAIEDGVALGIVLTNCTPDDLPKRLEIFESIRRNRASVMQQFSNAGQDEPEKIQAEASKFMPAEEVPKSTEEFFSYNFGYDVIKHSKQAMLEEYPTWELPADFFEKEPGVGTYP